MFRRRLTSAQRLLSLKAAAEANTALCCNLPAKTFVRFPSLASLLRLLIGLWLSLFAVLLPATAQSLWPEKALAELDTIHVTQLPPEARATLALIRRDGPFPYAKDGAPFYNREGLLPARPRGYYREYTVPTPGARNRGARRIVVGRDGDLWYTDDHYRSFKRILE